MAAAGSDAAPLVHMALPKGHMKENVFKMMEEAGIKVKLGNDRAYRPSISEPGYDVKLLKPQNILGLLKTGARDVGFAGLDWATELGLVEDVVQLLDTKLDPVRIVAASPDPDVLAKGVGAGGRKLIVASEYETICRQWIKDKGLNAEFLRAYGATESLPPEDADIIVDNTATGSTLRANNLHILETITQSSTRLFASKSAIADKAKKAVLDKFVLLLKSVLHARERSLVQFNVAEEKLEEVLEGLPSMRAPSVTQLRGSGGFSVSTAVPSGQVPALLPALKKHGATDILVLPIKQLVA